MFQVKPRQEQQLSDTKELSEWGNNKSPFEHVVNHAGQRIVQIACGGAHSALLTGKRDLSFTYVPNTEKD